MRSLKPWPGTCARFTPSSPAKRRTDGLACARVKPGSSIGARSLRYEVGTPRSERGVSTAPRSGGADDFSGAGARTGDGGAVVAVASAAGGGCVAGGAAGRDGVAGAVATGAADA